MKNACLSILAAVLLLSVVLPAAVPGQEIKAVLKDFTGEVEIKLKGSDWKPGTVGSRLGAGDYIATSFASTALLKLPDKTIVRLKELSQIKIDRLFAGKKTIRTLLKMRTGEIEARVHRAAGIDHDFKVKTPTSTIGVRGTEERITVMEGFGTLVEVLSGQVAVENEVGQQLSMTKGDQTTIEQADTPPTLPSEQRYEEASAEVADIGRTDEEKEEMRTQGTQPAVDTTEEEVSDTPGMSNTDAATLQLEWEF